MLVSFTEEPEVQPERTPEDKSPEFPEELNNMKPHRLSTGRFLTMHKRRRKRLLTRSLCKENALLDDLSLGQVQVSACPLDALGCADDCGLGSHAWEALSTAAYKLTSA